MVRGIIERPVHILTTVAQLQIFISIHLLALLHQRKSGQPPPASYILAS